MSAPGQHARFTDWEIHDQESGELARELVTRTVLKEKFAGQPLVLHSNNGSPMKASTLQAKLDELDSQSSDIKDKTKPFWNGENTSARWQ